MDPTKVSAAVKQPTDKVDNNNKKDVYKSSKDGSEHRSLYNRCATLPVFTASYSVCVLFWEAINTYLPSQITSIEREFGISSTTSGTLMGTLQYGYLASTLFMNHFGKGRHIPRLIAIFAIAVGIIGMIPSVVELMTLEAPSASKQVSGTNSTSSLSSAVLCQASEAFDPTSDIPVNPTPGSGNPTASEANPRRWIVYVIGACMVLIGVAKSVQVPLVVHYIDNSIADKTKTAVLAGTLYTAVVLGSSLSLLIGSYTSTLPVDLGRDTDSKLTESDPRWVGAWWLGYFIFGIACITLAIPLFFFPREYKRENDLKKDTSHEKGGNSEAAKDSHEASSAVKLLKSFPAAIFRIISIPVVPLIYTGVAIGGMVIGGYRAFGPKYLMVEFDIPSWQANIALGVAGGLSAVLGPLLGGALTTRLKLDKVTALRFSAICCVLASASVALNIYFGCSNQHIIGLNSALDGQNASLVAENCRCQNKPFLVSCGDDGQNYLSPCYAGCDSFNITTYDHCSLLGGGSIKPGKCGVSCNNLIPFVIIMFFSSTLVLLILMPLTIVVLRNVSDKDKSLAMSCVQFVLALAGLIPGPIVFGKLIDSACTRWSSGACNLYDVDQLRYRVIGTTLGLNIICTIFISFAYVIGVRNAKRESRKSMEITLVTLENGKTVFITKL